VEVALAQADRAWHLGVKMGQTPISGRSEIGVCPDFHGTWQATVEATGRDLQVTGTGSVQRKIGPQVQRRVVVIARSEDAGFRVLSWRRVPVPMPSAEGRPPASAAGPEGMR
jgi:hypothetical protein